MTNTSRPPVFWSLRGLLGATALGLLATASGQAFAADPIKIGVIAEAQAIAGASIPQAAQMAADEINAKGGVDGRKIEIVTYDNHSSSADSVRAFQRAVNEDKVNVVIASYISEVVLALEPWASRLKTPFITPGAASNEISKSVHKRLREEQIHLPRLSDLGRAGAVGLRRRQGTAGRPEAHEDRRHHERGRRLDQAARRRIRGMPAQDRPEGARPHPLLARHHRLHPDLQQDRRREARRDHHRHFACRRAADGAVEEPAGADPDARHQLAGDQRNLRQGHQRRVRRRALSGRLRSGRRGDAEVDSVRRRLQEEVRQLSVLCRLHLL